MNTATSNLLTLGNHNLDAGKRLAIRVTSVDVTLGAQTMDAVRRLGLVAACDWLVRTLYAIDIAVCWWMSEEQIEALMTLANDAADCGA